MKHNYQVGSTVICINNFGHEQTLKLNMEYIVLAMTKHGEIIVSIDGNDSSHRITVRADRFIGKENHE